MKLRIRRSYRRTDKKIRRRRISRMFNFVYCCFCLAVGFASTFVVQLSGFSFELNKLFCSFFLDTAPPKPSRKGHHVHQRFHRTASTVEP